MGEKAQIRQNGEIPHLLGDVGNSAYTRIETSPNSYQLLTLFDGPKGVNVSLTGQAVFALLE